VVIGANGKTGKRVCKYAAENGWDVIAATRDGNFPSLSEIKEDARGRVTTKQCSVTSSMAEITNAIDGAESVIFAASSSKNGGTPQEIDRDGCIKVARACLSSKSVKRYVVVTSGAVSKPYSPVYIFLNLFGGIMRAKIEGEDAVRALYYEREDDFYTIVRPGGLTEDPPRGVSACELNQGDDTSGRVSREDVAAVCVECCKRDDAKNATFELYYRDTGKPMAEVFASNANKETDGERQMGPRGRRGETWDELFAGLEADAPGIPQKGEGFSL
jgi:nucleoside-diphosphate-sugar epimerase